MASCCRRYRARRLKALGHDPQLLVIRPAPPATSLDHLKPFKLSTALMAVHKDCYAPIELIQQGGSRRRETLRLHETPNLGVHQNRKRLRSADQRAKSSRSCSRFLLRFFSDYGGARPASKYFARYAMTHSYQRTFDCNRKRQGDSGCQ